jgi:hypothetical protein
MNETNIELADYTLNLNAYKPKIYIHLCQNTSV